MVWVETVDGDLLNLAFVRRITVVGGDDEWCVVAVGHRPHEEECEWVLYKGIHEEGARGAMAKHKEVLGVT